MVYKKRPKKFKPIFEVVSCYIEAGGQLLLLRRHQDKIEGNKWGLVGGKIEKGETNIEALIREVKEEAGVKLKPSQIKYVSKVYVKYPKFHYVFNMYYALLTSKPTINLRLIEHNDYRWFKYNEALKTKLVNGNRTCLKLIHKKIYG